jgi:O-methyltransferase
MQWSIGSVLLSSFLSAVLARLLAGTEVELSSNALGSAAACGIVACFLTALLFMRSPSPAKGEVTVTEEEYAQLVPAPAQSATQSTLYLDMVKRVLLNVPYHEQSYQAALTRSRERGRTDPCLVNRGGFSLRDRVLGEDLSLNTLSMIGLKRLDSLQACVETVLAEGVEGDLIETGCAKGGACILMRAVLRAKKDRSRRVIACDAFSESKPPPRASVEVLAYCILRPLHLLLTLISYFPSERWHLRLYATLMRLQHHFPVDTDHVSQDTVRSFLFFLRRGHRFIRPTIPPVGTGLAAVRSHFARLGLLDEQVVFLKGFFDQTLPTAPVDRLALLRLDGDLYASTMDALTVLYPKLSPGAFCGTRIPPRHVPARKHLLARPHAQGTPLCVLRRHCPDLALSLRVCPSALCLLHSCRRLLLI